MTVCARREVACLIVAALAGESQHAAEIVARVRDMSGGRVQLRAGTLFTVLDRLCADDLVTIESDEVVGSRLRRYYGLASAGRERRAEPAPLSLRPDLRVSDADRDEAAAALGDCFAQGGLTATELHARLDLALAAVTRRDIWRATGDLPSQHVTGRRVRRW